MSRGRKPTPTPEELEDWKKVARSVAPLAGRPPPVEPPPAPEPPKPAKRKRPPVAPAKPPVKPRPPPPPPPVERQIDRRTMSRINRGAVAIDARVDLHGLTQAEAHNRLVGFLRNAQGSGARIVLVITGKGLAGSDGERGVLKRAVPGWLSGPELRPLIIGFDEAGRSHGGSGALYVRLKRLRGG